MKDLKNMIGSDETIIWEGRPDKKCSICESIFNPLLPFALVWASIDLGILFGTGIAEVQEAKFFIVPFFLFHLMPVWLYLFGVIFSIKRIKNTQYLITDKGIYVSGGFINFNYNMKPYAEISSVTMHQGLFDRWFKAGDVILGTSTKMNIMNVKDYERVYKLLKQIQTDVFADIMYPNALRPDNNPGYTTKIDKDKYKF